MGLGYDGNLLGPEVEGMTNPAIADLDMAGYNITMGTGWIGRAASAVTFDANENVVITEGLYLGSNGIGNNAEVLSFATGATGLATLAGALTIAGDLTMTGTATNHLLLPINNDAATPTLAFGDGDSGFYESEDDTIMAATLGQPRWYIQSTVFSSAETYGPQLKYNPSGTDVHFRWAGDEGTGMLRSAASQPSMHGGGIEAQRWIPTADTDSDTDDVLLTGVSGFHGLALVVDLTGNTSAFFHVDNVTVTGDISLNAAITSTKDNAGTYNFYYETDQFKLQNKVGDNKSLKVVFWCLPT